MEELDEIPHRYLADVLPAGFAEDLIGIDLAAEYLPDLIREDGIELLPEGRKPASERCPPGLVPSRLSARVAAAVLVPSRDAVRA